MKYFDVKFQKSLYLFVSNFFPKSHEFGNGSINGVVLCIQRFLEGHFFVCWMQCLQLKFGW